MKILRLIITIYLGVLVITTAVLFQLIKRTELPLIVVIGRIEGDDGIYWLNPYDDEVIELVDADTDRVQSTENVTVASTSDAITVNHPRNPHLSVSYDISFAARLRSISPTGDWLLYYDLNAGGRLIAVQAEAPGRLTVIDYEVQPSEVPLALWWQESSLVLGSISEPGDILLADLHTGNVKKLSHGQILPQTEGNRWYFRVHGEQIVVIDEAGYLKHVDVRNGAETVLVDKEAFSNIRVIRTGPQWLVYSEQTQDSMTFSRFHLATGQTEELWSTNNSYTVDYTSLDGSLFVFEEQTPSPKLYVFTQENGLETIQHDLNDSTLVRFDAGWFNVLNNEGRSTSPGTRGELVLVDGEWHIQPIEVSPRAAQPPTAQGWIVQQEYYGGWVLSNTQTSKTYPLNARIASNAQFRILEFDPDAPLTAQRNIVYVSLGLAVLLGLSQMGFIRRRSIMP